MKRLQGFVTNRAWWSLGAALIPLLSACGGPMPEGTEEASIGEEASPLKNAKLYDGSTLWRGVVKIDFWNTTNGWWSCSGQVVSQQTILTAAHCVARLTEGGPANPGMLWAKVARPTSTGWTTVMPLTWVTVTYNSAYDLFHTTYDVGLVYAPSVQLLQNVTAADAAVLAKAAPNNTSMRALGFGYYGTSDSEYDGKGRAANLTPTYSTTDKDYSFTDSNGKLPEICSGDSGGPLKSGFQYGVASQGSGNGSGHCRATSHWATTKENMSWLKGHIMAPNGCLDTSTLLSCW